MNKIIKLTLLLALFLLLGLGVYVYQAIMGNNIKEDLASKELYIASGTEMDELESMLTSQVVKNSTSFSLVANLMKFTKVKSGKYALKDEMSNKELISLLRAGRQSPVNVTFNNVRDYHQLVGKIAPFLESDSTQIDQYFGELINKQSIDEQLFLCDFIPNTYEMYWDTTPEQFVARMRKEQQKFWAQNNRVKKAADQGLSPDEVYTLASIVQKESNLNSEKPLIAGVYLNRLDRGIALQADPTVVFANGLFDLKRVLNVHLEFDSPYNTYMNSGLPPGPIYMPSIASIDAVLSPKKDDNYLYFCAKPGYDGGHLFAKSLIAHNENAQVYWRWLNKEGIK